ncbi:hypothetical protein BYT27DRAFT_6436258 [Phlegmacium glaucopus]|nr:hypothetical protein BYT27DRAFT_6436258 [Phlegmacium glaucopus]
MPSTSPSVLTQIVTTARQGGSVATFDVTLFPTATSQASALTAVPLSTVVGTVGGSIAFFMLLLLLFLCHRQQKAKNDRFALMGLSSDDVESRLSSISLIICLLFDMSQNCTTMATPFTLGPSPPSSTDLNATHDSPRLPLFYAMSEKVLRQPTRANRAETDPEAASTPPDLAPSWASSNASAFLVSALSTHAPGSNSLNQPSLDPSPLSEPFFQLDLRDLRNQIGRMQTTILLTTCDIYLRVPWRLHMEGSRKATMCRLHIDPTNNRRSSGMAEPIFITITVNDLSTPFGRWTGLFPFVCGFNVQTLVHHLHSFT